jgi:hypothetical protein
MENENNKSKIFNRESLYEKFKNGKRPVEKDFEDLINSTVNRLDDGISKNFDTGLELAPQGENGEEIMSLFEKINDLLPSWKFKLVGDSGNKRLCIASSKLGDALVITRENKVGINCKDPKFELDVAGVVGSAGRVGTFAHGEVPADGQWKTILLDLKGVNAFEMMAVAHATDGKGKYAMLHAFLLNAYSGNSGRIKKIHNIYGWKWWNRINVRWKGDPFNYSLEIRSGANFGEGAVLKYNIGKLI